jgi:apolipoprotein N-acyltransferase
LVCVAFAAAGGLLLGAAQARDPGAATALIGLGLLTAGWFGAAQAGPMGWVGVLLRGLVMAAGLACWQLQALDWLTVALPPAQRPWGPALQSANVVLNLMVWLPLAVVLGWWLRVASPRAAAWAAPAFSWGLAWWGWQLVRESTWWGGGYGSLALPLLDWPPFAALLPWAGAGLAEGLVASAVAGLLALLAHFWQRGQVWRFVLLVLCAGGALAAGQRLVVAAPGAVRFAPVMALPAPAIRTDGWNMAQRDAALAELHQALTASQAGAVIVTSEGYFGEPPPSEPVGAWADLLAAVQAGGQHVLLGMPIAYRSPEGLSLMNGVLQLSPTGPDGHLRSALYGKQRLAPGGETLPWPRLMRPLLGLDAAAGPERMQAATTELNQALYVAQEGVALNVCHELAFGLSLAEQSLKAGWLLNMAYDAWLPSAGFRLQAQRLARLRALELGKAMLRVSQGSGTLLVDADGRLLGAWPGAHHVLVPVRDAASAYANWSKWQRSVALGLMATMGLLCLLAQLTRRTECKP